MRERPLPLLAALLPMAVCADGFEGHWMVTIEAPGVVPYEARLDVERDGDSWHAWIENGPAPVVIEGDRIELHADSRDRQGFRFERLLDGRLDGGEIRGTVTMIDLAETAAENGENGSAWHAVRFDGQPHRDSSAYTLSDYAGTWVAVRGRDVRKYTMDLTLKGKEWVAAYDARMDEPQKRCVSPGLVAAVTWMFPFEIIVSEHRNRLTMMYEAFNLFRRVYLDQSHLPEFYPESSMGYSQGRFEDGELVIETTLLSHNTRDFNGEPVSTDTRIEERYYLTGDGRRLNVIMTMHDPGNYNRPPIRRRAWDRNDEATIYPFECDPDSFFRQLFSEGLMQEYIDRSYMRP